MDCLPGQKNSGRYREVAVSGGSSVSSKMQMRLLGIFGIFLVTVVS